MAEAPFPMPQQWFLNAPYMVNATRHWKPILNGYSGFRPPCTTILRSDARVPVRRVVAGLVKIGVTHVVVHQRAMNHGRRTIVSTRRERGVTPTGRAR